MLDSLDDAAVHRWCGGGLAALRAHQHEIDSLNVYPVPDGDTGTNLVLTLASAQQALEELARQEGCPADGRRPADSGPSPAAAAAPASPPSPSSCLPSASPSAPASPPQASPPQPSPPQASPPQPSPPQASPSSPASPSPDASDAPASTGRLPAGGGSVGTGAAEPGGEPGQTPLARAMRRMARGALLGARGNSGVIVSQILRGMAEEFAGAVAVRGGELARALRSASEAAYAAVARPVEGTVLSVVAAAAAAADRVRSDDLVAVARAASRAAAEALARTPQQLPVLARAGVVDAGGRGLCLLLDALVDALSTDSPTNARTDPAARTGSGPAAGSDPATGTGSGLAAGAGSDQVAGTGFQSAAGFGSEPAAGTGSEPAAETGSEFAAGTGSEFAAGTGSEFAAGTGSGSAAGTGSGSAAGTGSGSAAGTGLEPAAHAGAADPVAVLVPLSPAGNAPRVPGLHSADDSVPPAADAHPPHQHVRPGEGPTDYGYEVQYLLDAEPDAVARLKERLAALGDSLVVVGTGDGTWNVHVHVADIGAAVEAGVEAGRPHRISVTRLEDHLSGHDGGVDPDGRGAVVVAAGDGLTALFAAEGAVVVDRNPSTAEMLDAIAATRAARVVLLPNDANTHAVANSAAREAAATGVRVSVVPTRSPVQALAALAVRDPHRRFGDDVIAMAEAAGACRYGEVCTAQREALTVAGRCRPGEMLGLVDGEVHIIGGDLHEVSRRLLDRMLGGGGELITLVLGADAPPTLEQALRDHLAHTWPFVELQCYTGGQPRYHLLVGVE